MSMIIDKITIVGTKFDRRRRLTEKDRAKIRQLRADGWAIRAIARLYPSISRRLIQFILYPDRILASRANRDWRKYYQSATHRQSIGNLRRYKKQLLQKGLLKTTSCNATRRRYDDALPPPHPLNLCLNCLLTISNYLV